MITLANRITRRAATAGESTQRDYLVLDLSSGRYFGLGEVGGFIWQRLDGSRDLAAIAAEVAEHFGVTAERARADLLEFVAQLVDDGLAEVTGD